MFQLYFHEHLGGHWNMMNEYINQIWCTHASLQVHQDYVFRVVHFYDRQVRCEKTRGRSLKSVACLPEKYCW